MDREMRKRKLENQVKDTKWINPFSEECIKEIFEKRDKTSEARLSKITDSQKAAKAFAREASVLAREYGLETVIAANKISVPNFDDDVNFQYTTALRDFETWLDDGDDAVAVFIKEEDKVIAFGLAHKEDHKTEIEVIEVEINSTRRAGLLKQIEIESLSFEIGVGHLVVLRLLDTCRTPIWTDATNDESRYIFKSLGFVHDKANNNPCILKKE